MTFVKNQSTHSSTTISPRRGMMKLALALMLFIIMPATQDTAEHSTAHGFENTQRQGQRGVLPCLDKLLVLSLLNC